MDGHGLQRAVPNHSRDFVRRSLLRGDSSFSLSPAKAQLQDQYHPAGVKTTVHNNPGHGKTMSELQQSQVVIHVIIKPVPFSAMTYFNIPPILGIPYYYNRDFKFPNPMRADSNVYIMIKVCIIMCNAFVYYLLGLDIDDVIIHR